MKVHSSITLDRVMAAVENRDNWNNSGFCLACGEDADSCEPDAREYICEVCGAPAVYGAEEILLMGVL